MKLYGICLSPYVRKVAVVINVKGLECEREDAFPGSLSRAISPLGKIPALQDGALTLADSSVICEYLEEIHPEPQLLPGSARDRATVRGMAMVVACDTHPLNNLPIMGYLRHEFGADDVAVNRWVAHWIGRGFSGLERWVGSIPGAPVEVGQQRFCLFGSSVL